MTWVVLFALVVLVLVTVLRLMRGKREGWEAVAAALMVGLAGYALQGKPTMPSAMKAPSNPAAGNGRALVEERQKLAGDDLMKNRWIVPGDALAMHGQYAEAATVLRGAVEADPRNGDAWLAMANALVSHAEGNISPAALYAFRMAQKADPKAPGPPFFLGLAMARAGRFDETRALWADLVARAPADAPWREDIAMRLKRLDELMEMLNRRAQAEAAAQQGAPMGRPLAAPMAAPQ